MNRKVRVAVGMMAIIMSIGFMMRSVADNKRKKKQQEFIRDLGRQQLEERIEREKKQLEELNNKINTEMKTELDSIQRGLDELSKDLDNVGENLKKLNQDIDLN